MGKNKEVLILVVLLSNVVYGEGKIYWQENGVCICESTFSGGGPGIEIVNDRCGGAIVVWADCRGDYDRICAQRIDNSGNILWDTNGIIITTGAVALVGLKPYATTDGKSGAIIIWSYYGKGIYAARVDSSGIKQWQTTIREPIGGDSTTECPSITSEDGGNVVIVWTETDGGYGNIYAQRVDVNGNKKWGNKGIPVCTLYSASWPYSGVSGITNIGGKDVIVAWTDHRNGDHDIYAQMIDSLGNAMWAPNGISVCDTVGIQYTSTELIRKLENTAIITWSDKRGDDWDIYIQKVDTTGEEEWGLNGVPVCTQDGDQAGFGTGTKLALVTSLKSAVVAWRDKRSGNLDIYIQKLDLDGVRQWENNGVFIYSSADSLQESIDFAIQGDNHGGVIVAWKDYRAGNWDIYAQRVDSSGTLQWGDSTLVVCIDTATQGSPAIVSDEKDGAIIAWGDNRRLSHPPAPAGGCVYVQRVGDGEQGIEEVESSELRVQSQLQIKPNPFVGTTAIKLSMES